MEHLGITDSIMIFICFAILYNTNGEETWIYVSSQITRLNVLFKVFERTILRV